MIYFFYLIEIHNENLIAVQSSVLQLSSYGGFFISLSLIMFIEYPMISSSNSLVALQTVVPVLLKLSRKGFVSGDYDTCFAFLRLSYVKFLIIFPSLSCCSSTRMFVSVSPAKALKVHLLCVLF